MVADMSRFAVLLCRAQEAGNVGSACRAMKTMGISELILADCPEYDVSRVATMAVHAFDVYERAIRFDRLEDAMAGFSLSAGFTRRRGERRKSQSLSVRDFATSLPPGQGRIALVFGNEKDGLSDSELTCCSRAVHIPSSDAFPSLNLAQAVQVACYEVFVAELSGRDGSADPVERAEAERAATMMTEALASLGFFSKTDDSTCKVFLRDVAERAGMGKRELDYFTRLFLKAAALSSGKGSPRRRAHRQI